MCDSTGVARVVRTTPDNQATTETDMTHFYDPGVIRDRDGFDPWAEWSFL